MNDLPKRKQIRITDYDYSRPGRNSLQFAPQTGRKSSGLTVGANCVRPSTTLRPVLPKGGKREM